MVPKENKMAVFLTENFGVPRVTAVAEGAFLLVRDGVQNLLQHPTSLKM